MNGVVLEKGSVSVKNVALAIAFLIISSKITLPFYPVPLTLQMFAVYFLGLALSPRESFLAGLGWLVLGSIGLPVFATGQIGLFRPTVGYLVGMLFGMPLIGYLVSKKVSYYFSCIISLILIYAAGCLGLAAFGFDHLIQMGVAPFVVSDILKIALANSLFILIRKGFKK